MSTWELDIGGGFLVKDGYRMLVLPLVGKLIALSLFYNLLSFFNFLGIATVPPTYVNNLFTVVYRNT